jgi:hypothetical protein
MPDELARLGGHVRQQVHRGLREAEPRVAAGHLAIGGPEATLALGRGEDLEDADTVCLDIGG